MAQDNFTFPFENLQRQKKNYFSFFFPDDDLWKESRPEEDRKWRRGKTIYCKMTS